jgi:hypothetical protein
VLRIYPAKALLRKYYGKENPMSFSDRIASFTTTRSKADLDDIVRKNGDYGFTLACKAAGITRRAGRKILGIAEHDYRPHQLASRFGYRTSQLNYQTKSP